MRHDERMKGIGKEFQGINYTLWVTLEFECTQTQVKLKSFISVIRHEANQRMRLQNIMWFWNISLTINTTFYASMYSIEIFIFNY